jgi:hypothetical protein
MQKPLVFLALAALALTACDKRTDTSQAVVSGHLAQAGSSGNLIGTPPGEPTKSDGTDNTVGKPLRETPETTSTSDEKKELSKGEESARMPLAGQPNDHSNVASDASQKAGQADPQQMPERRGDSNAPQRDSQAATQK